MKRIYKAINEAINNSIMQFGDDQGFKKTAAAGPSIKKFSLGDYVYYDPNIGYNSLTGEKVAICVNDIPGKELYAVIDHPYFSSFNCYQWAKDPWQLYKDNLQEIKDMNGWDATQYILYEYSRNIKDTIWDKLRPNEYIPSIDELETIYNNCIGSDIFDEAGFFESTYWSCQVKLQSYSDTHSTEAYTFSFEDGTRQTDEKDSLDERAIALLHID